jgi:hypothetical protein
MPQLGFTSLGRCGSSTTEDLWQFNTNFRPNQSVSTGGRRINAARTRRAIRPCYGFGTEMPEFHRMSVSTSERTAFDLRRSYAPSVRNAICASRELTHSYVSHFFPSRGLLSAQAVLAPYQGAMPLIDRSVIRWAQSQFSLFRQHRLKCSTDIDSVFSSLLPNSRLGSKNLENDWQKLSALFFPGRQRGDTRVDTSSVRSGHFLDHVRNVSESMGPAVPVRHDLVPQKMTRQIAQLGDCLVVNTPVTRHVNHLDGPRISKKFQAHAG